MCHDRRAYTAATIAEMQRIALVVEWQRKVRERQATMYYPGRSTMVMGIVAGLELAMMIMDDIMQCDDPEQPTQADTHHCRRCGRDCRNIGLFDGLCRLCLEAEAVQP